MFVEEDPSSILCHSWGRDWFQRIWELRMSGIDNFAGLRGFAVESHLVVPIVEVCQRGVSLAEKI
jgi:hypothetical protein